MPEKAKNRANLQQRVSLRITLPKIILSQNDTKALKIMFPAAKIDWAKNAKKKSQKQNKLAAVHFTTYYPSIKRAFTKRQQIIKN